ncbi:MAG: glycoside hydrolase family 3 protein [Spirochaetaceae bacterium]|jgi:beta-N-acetylhexosaminidase|nr:glycoside hydrolase family 3 protein [Spirochaetaceae bacterium]
MRGGCFSLALCILFPVTGLYGELPGDAAREYAVRLARGLDDRQLAAQVLLTGIDGAGVLEDSMKALLNRIPAGGIVLFKYNLSVERNQIAPFLESAAAAASVRGILPEGGVTIPPFIAADHEGGMVHRFDRGVGRLSAPAVYWEMAVARGWDLALEYVESTARRSGREIRALGLTLNLAPVAEPLTEKNRDFLGSRSYGPDPRFVERAAAAFIRGMEEGGVSCAVKHFPGNTGVDPHEKTVVLDADREELDVMIAPMAALIRAGIPAVMVSHTLVPAWDSGHIASLSPRVIQTWLREELGFTGVVLADDFSMGAAASARTPEDAVVEALNAGVDMTIAWPGNLASIHGAVLKALEEGRLSRARLEEAAGRILYEKIRRGLIAAGREETGDGAGNQ